jgi:hypothetical protein
MRQKRMNRHSTRKLSLALPLHIRARDAVRSAWRDTEWFPALTIGAVMFVVLAVLLVEVLALAG